MVGVAGDFYNAWKIMHRFARKFEKMFKNSVSHTSRKQNDEIAEVP